MPRRVHVRTLKAGDLFFEIDHGVAVKWLALEDAKPDGREGSSCLCQRRSGVQMVFHDFCKNSTRRLPVLVDDVDPKKVMIL